mmetsp:Transcript_1240/g.5042  ORF Transcript_1240/g.5042 Transcript_1240/m.5042 type:complete len:247 (+) Transcript_1240:1868-2608(+)
MRWSAPRGSPSSRATSRGTGCRTRRAGPPPRCSTPSRRRACTSPSSAAIPPSPRPPRSTTGSRRTWRGWRGAGPRGWWSCCTRRGTTATWRTTGRWTRCRPPWSPSWPPRTWTSCWRGTCTRTSAPSRWSRARCRRAARRTSTSGTAGTARGWPPSTRIRSPPTLRSARRRLATASSRCTTPRTRRGRGIETRTASPWWGTACNSRAPRGAGRPGVEGGAQRSQREGAERKVICSRRERGARGDVQ